MTAELPRPVSIDRLPGQVVVEADAAECAALAARMGIPDVLSVSCRWLLRRHEDVVEAVGELWAEVVQSCVATLEPVPQSVRDSFAVRFVPAGQEGDEDPDSTDELPYEGRTIDLGEATAEQLALALEPYPRADGPALDVEEGDRPHNPFAVLRRPG